MSKCEITVSEYCKFLDENPQFWPGVEYGVEQGIFYNFVEKTFEPIFDVSYPVRNVSWNAAKAYCRWLSYKTGDVYRLPTEAEWEYACRAGTTTNYWWGDSKENDKADFSNPNRVHQVGIYSPNSFGLYDMHGNVSEWCEDSYDENYYNSSSYTNPMGPEGNYAFKVTRGGNVFMNLAEQYFQSWYRGTEIKNVGIRVVKVSQTDVLSIKSMVEMVAISGGTFIMGDQSEDPNPYYSPAHQVRVSNFEIGKYEITNKEYCIFLNNGNSDNYDEMTDIVLNDNGLYEPAQYMDDHPVVKMDYENVEAFCMWLSQVTGEKYRLPTEAEWECACRAGTTTNYWWGDEFDSTKCISNVGNDYDDNDGTPTAILGPVTTGLPNGFGLYNIVGNASELCSDWWWYYSDTPQVNPTGPSDYTSYGHVMRGGSHWDIYESAFASFARDTYNETDYWRTSTGFRIVKEVFDPEYPEMVLIPAGTFTMGDAAGVGFSDESPTHEVTLDSFYIGKYEISNKQFCDFLNDQNKNYYSPLMSDSTYGGIFHNENAVVFYPKQYLENYAVTHIDRATAIAYCNWLSERTGDTYRLPTEAEWEYACRAGTTTKYSFGNDISETDAWYERTAVNFVNALLPNQFGIYNMHGNAWEWCSDFYDEDYYFYSDSNNPKGPSSGSYGVLRGGSWDNSAGYLRSANRAKLAPTEKLKTNGFRVVKEVSSSN